MNVGSPLQTINKDYFIKKNILQHSIKKAHVE